VVGITAFSSLRFTACSCLRPEYVGAQSRYVLSKVHLVGGELIDAFQCNLIWFAIRSMLDALDVLLRFD
jgi:hypothetical protein